MRSASDNIMLKIAAMRVEREAGIKREVVRATKSLERYMKKVADRKAVRKPADAAVAQKEISTSDEEEDD
jgi:hypothetical protein